VSVDRHELAHPGAHAGSPTNIPARGWRQIVVRALHRAFLDRVTLIAAGVAFFGFLALFPSLIAAVLLYGLVSTPADLAEHVEALARTLPGAAADLLAEQMQDLVDADQGRLGVAAVISVLVALWSAFVGMDHLLVSVNVVYAETERSGFLRRRGLALVFTLASAVVFAVLLTLVAIVPAVVDGGFLLGLGRWLLVLTVFALSLGALYRYGPDRRQPRFAWVTVGALVATAFWLVASAVFSLYVSEFDRYSRSYGALAGVVVLLVWMWLSVVAVLLGAEINAEAEHQTDADSTVGPDRPRGARDAVKADEAVGRPLHAPRHADGPPHEGPDEADSLDRSQEAIAHPAERARPHRPGHQP
jgi:membrane protein